MQSNQKIVITQSEYSSSVRYLLSDLNICGYFLDDDAKKEAYSECPVYTSTDIEELKLMNIILIACHPKNETEIAQYVNLGWTYKSNFFFIDEYIKYILLKEYELRYKNKKLIIWGCGLRGKEFLRKIKEFGLNVIFCIDTDKEKIGKLCEDKQIFAPDILLQKKKEEIFIIVTTDYYREVKAWLETNHFIDRTNYLHYKTFIDFSLPDLILKSIFAQSINTWECQDPFRMFRLRTSGEIFCCHRPGWIKKSIGNALTDSFDDIKTSILYKAIKLSVINRNYIFCRSNKCEMLLHPAKAEHNIKMFQKIDDTCNCADFDESCNLYCESCRNEIKISKSEKKKYLLEYFQKNILPETNILMTAGSGEVFLSQYYNSLLDNLEFKEVNGILLLSNGLLFDEAKTLKWGAKVNGNIGIAVSIDAAIEETYRRMRRGGNFKVLCEKLEKISKLRKENKIILFDLIFVMQRQNYLEMYDFVKWAEKLFVDAVNFVKIDNWGTYTDEYYEKICMYQKDGNPVAELKTEFERIEQKQSRTKVFLNDCYGHRLFMYEKLARIEDKADGMGNEYR